ncbi:MAG TPA: hypothetical protein VF904_16965 [Anaeromyxobacteraceae bacterium]
MAIIAIPDARETARDTTGDPGPGSQDDSGEQRGVQRLTSTLVMKEVVPERLLLDQRQ